MGAWRVRHAYRSTFAGGGSDCAARPRAAKGSAGAASPLSIYTGMPNLACGSLEWETISGKAIG